MEIFQAIILGIVQGLTEFLPISSSGHLVLIPWVFSWADPGLSFDVALHFGTLIAVVLYFWKDWLMIISVAARKVFKKKNISNGEYGSNTLFFLIVATMPGVLAGYFLNDFAETVFRNPLLIFSTLIIFGFLLYLADKQFRQKKEISEITLVDALTVGFAQAMAIIPGVSRSGITITAGLMQGLDRKSAARFSFLMSTPIIFGAAAYQAKDFFTSQIGVFEISGILSAAISGYLAIFVLMKFVERVGYKLFFWYRLVLALIILILVFLR